jgi:hypothetical protein
VDDETLLGNEPVTQQWKGIDRCYAIAQYTGVNNGVEDVSCGRCGGYIRECSAEQQGEENSYRAEQSSAVPV